MGRRAKRKLWCKFLYDNRWVRVYVCDPEVCSEIFGYEGLYLTRTKGGLTWHELLISKGFSQENSEKILLHEIQHLAEDLSGGRNAATRYLEVGPETYKEAEEIRTRCASPELYAILKQFGLRIQRLPKW